MDLVFISNASAVSIQIQIQEGFILSLSVAIHDGTFYHSDTFTLSFSWAQQLMETEGDDVDCRLNVKVRVHEQDCIYVMYRVSPRVRPTTPARTLGVP